MIAICNRCLVLPANALLSAKYKDDSPYGGHWQFHETCYNVGYVLGVRDWVMERADKEDIEFELNGQRGAVIPVSTWHGDPVCAIHLQYLTDREAGIRAS